MDTDIAYRHQLYPHFHSPSSANAYTMSKAPVAHHPRLGRVGSIAPSSPRLQQPIQYPHPLQTVKSPFPTSSYPHDSGSHVAGLEHMLRRKTPNGTLAAGYDGRPVEWAKRRPANKHFIMPASISSGDAICQPPGRQMGYDKQIAQRVPSSENPWRHNTDSNVKPFSALGIDSVLCQGSPSYLPGPHASGQQIPMMMQPMWPPCVGITSLNHAGPYGPYWPNGAFVPYRPAPIRDPRFHTGLDERFLLDGTLTHAHTSNKSHLVPVTDSCRSRLPLMTHGATSSQHTLAYGTYQLTDPGEISTRAYSNSLLNSKTSGHHPTFNPDAGPLSTFSGLSTDAASPNQEDLVVTNVRYNEQILIWAHRVYMNLLSSRLPNRRTGSNVQRPSHRYPPEQILPQLPQGTSFGSRKLHNNDTIRPSRYSVDPQENDPTAYQTLNGNSSLLSQCALVSEPGFSGPHNSSGIHAKHGSLPALQMEHDPSPTAAAICAIEILSRLGEESGWRWTDGMLLGGCLAYGLGEYTKAFKWYSKVLQCDPKLVDLPNGGR